MWLKLLYASFASFFIHYISPVNSGEVTIAYAPSHLRFGTANALHISDLDDVIATAMGYTPEILTWSGLTVTSAFDYPSAAVIFSMKDAGVPVELEGVYYDLKEDLHIQEWFKSLTNLVGARAQRPLYFDKIVAQDLGRGLHLESKPSIKYLNEKEEADSFFLEEMAHLSVLSDFVEGKSSVADNGQDILLVEIHSFSPLVKKYGQDSVEVKEAKNILRATLEQTIFNLRSFYKNRLLAISMMFSQEHQLRRKRDAPTFGEETKNKTNHNLANAYDEDYPVIFNIVLILSIMLILALVAVSASMAFMDPGRDSIIYRMTNPRMKKDQ